MNVVLDTNVLVVAFSRRSPHHWIFQRIFSGSLQISITTEILLEYEEVFERMFGAAVAETVVSALPDLPNVQTISTYFAWQLVSLDADDNKFVDCAIASGAAALVTEDHHILSLRGLSFPLINILTIAEFSEMEMQKNP